VRINVCVNFDVVKHLHQPGRDSSPAGAAAIRHFRPPRIALSRPKPASLAAAAGKMKLPSTYIGETQ
jgi:hypothetical protein